MTIAAPRWTMPKKMSSGSGPWKRDVEPETITIKRERGGDIIHDEERRNPGDIWFSRVSLHLLVSHTLTRAR
jgi:hypothetical protein